MEEGHAGPHSFHTARPPLQKLRKKPRNDMTSPSLVATSLDAICPAHASGANDDETVCLVCGREDGFLADVGPLMLCGPEGHTCSGAMHKGCAKLSDVPRGNWWCPRCRDARARASVQGKAKGKTKGNAKGKAKTKVKVKCNGNAVVPSGDGMKVPILLIDQGV